MQNTFSALPVKLLSCCVLLLSLAAGSAYGITGFRHPDAPRLFNYYLRSDIEGKEDVLAKWDMLVVPYKLLDDALPAIQSIRALNPDQVLLAYIDPVLISDNPSDVPGTLQYDFHAGIDSLWMAYSTLGEVITFWDHTLHVNITEVCPVIEGERYRDYFNRFIRERFFPFIEDGTIDGLFFDEMSNAGFTWWGPLFPGDFDYDLDGFADEPDSILNWLTNSFRMISDSTGLTLPQGGLVLGNNCKPHFGSLNGKLYESFPSDFTGHLEGTLNDMDIWSSLEMDENVTSVNGLFPNEDDLGQFRYRYTASLLTDNYFSYDYTTLDHYQLRWYELFETTLGQPLGPRYTIGESPTALSLFEGELGPWVAESGMSDLSLTSEPALVIQGEESLVADVFSAHEWPTLFEMFNSSGWGQVGSPRTYSVSFRYRILESEHESAALFLRYYTPQGSQYSGQTARAHIGVGSSGMYRAKFTLAGLDDYQIWLQCEGDMTAVIDSLAVVEGDGGLWARDYERGVVFCNDSGWPLTLPFDGHYELVNADGQYLAYSDWLVGGDIEIPNHDGVLFRYSGTAIGEEPASAAANSLSLRGPWPNPGNPIFHLGLDGEKGLPAVVSLHDIRGRRIAELWRGTLGPASQNLRFSAGEAPLPDLTSGVYLIRATAGDVALLRKWVLLR